MLIKNTNTYSVDIAMKTRTIKLGPGDEELLTADEVLDPELRAKLQIRAVSIVRPATNEEEGVEDGIVAPPPRQAGEYNAQGQDAEQDPLA